MGERLSEKSDYAIYGRDGEKIVQVTQAGYQSKGGQERFRAMLAAAQRIDEREEQLGCMPSISEVILPQETPKTHASIASAVAPPTQELHRGSMHISSTTIDAGTTTPSQAAWFVSEDMKVDTEKAGVVRPELLLTATAVVAGVACGLGSPPPYRRENTGNGKRRKSTSHHRPMPV